ncbi:hypothetical protein RND71_033243 [Anisodus tanguticus]|uniref:DUF8204 domain-containing protein n=1 Tax=Anisodus tanguticus TaxID=243964 RepID=A0AAE1R7D2_9SOLA|nr:hypothetical protein RND71_033243 [Anisodus tanguticus]
MLVWSQGEEKQMSEENDTIGKCNSCSVDGNSKNISHPIKEAGAGAGGTGSGKGVSSSATSSSSKNQGKSCKGCLYYSSTFKSNSRNPLCLGLSRSLPQVPRYIVGESEKEASKEGRSLTDFRYACVGYSVYLDQKSRSTDVQEAQTELPVCVGLENKYGEVRNLFLLEVLVDKRPTSADAVPAHTPAPAHAHNREGQIQNLPMQNYCTGSAVLVSALHSLNGHGLPQPRSNKPTNSAGDEFLTRQAVF